ncbi:hypothetical protein BASA81_011009 [Batrachochytrium salamandrivorans]|nr:hypothetical protein BASA81_011009 [Batrachochytrium salamandrivorans]
MQAGARVITQWEFKAENENELSVAQGVELVVLEAAGEWIRVQHGRLVGSVPVSYVKLMDVPKKGAPPVPKQRPVSKQASFSKPVPFVLPPLPPAFSQAESTGGFASNPMFVSRESSSNNIAAGGEEDEDDLVRRFEQLKSRMQSFDNDDQEEGGEEEEDVMEAIVVEAPPALPPPNSKLDLPALPPPNKPYPTLPTTTMTQQSAYLEAQERAQREHAEQQQLVQQQQQLIQQQQQEASRRRAEEMRRLAVEQAQLREQQMQNELDSALRHSTVLRRESKEANFIQLGEEKRSSALMYRNQGKLEESCRDSIAAMRYWLQAAKYGQFKTTQDRIDMLQRMERLVDEELSLPPLNEFTNPVEVIDVLVGMVNAGYPNLDGLKHSALKFRAEAARLEQEKQIDRAIMFFKQAAQRLLVIEKLLRAMGKNYQSVTEAATEIITHCEQLKRQRKSSGQA